MAAVHYTLNTKNIKLVNKKFFILSNIRKDILIQMPIIIEHTKLKHIVIYLIGVKMNVIMHICVGKCSCKEMNITGYVSLLPSFQLWVFSHLLS
jgi:hypothetical protein